MLKMPGTKVIPRKKKSKDSTGEKITSTKTKPKKKLADKIAEREALKEQQLASKAPLTEEEKLREKLRLEKIQENANVQLVRDMCGLKEKKIDSLVPVTKEDFDHFGKAISEKIQTSYRKSSFRKTQGRKSIEVKTENKRKKC